MEMVWADLVEDNDQWLVLGNTEMKHWGQSNAWNILNS
jgi:hypothetical protein